MAKPKHLGKMPYEEFWRRHKAISDLFKIDDVQAERDRQELQKEIRERGVEDEPRGPVTDG